MALEDVISEESLSEPEDKPSKKPQEKKPNYFEDSPKNSQKKPDDPSKDLMRLSMKSKQKKELVKPKISFAGNKRKDKLLEMKKKLEAHNLEKLKARDMPKSKPETIEIPLGKKTKPARPVKKPRMKDEWNFDDDKSDVKSSQKKANLGKKNDLDRFLVNDDELDKPKKGKRPVNDSVGWDNDPFA